MMGNFGPMGGFGFSFGWIFMLVFWILIIVALVYFIRWLSQSQSGRKNNSALDVLGERYAKGEINKKEYETKRKDLEK